MIIKDLASTDGLCSRKSRNVTLFIHNIRKEC
jgi:hypothetical protein